MFDYRYKRLPNGLKVWFLPGNYHEIIDKIRFSDRDFTSIQVNEMYGYVDELFST